MNLLAEGRLAPIGSTIGFLEIDCPRAAGAFADWQTGISRAHGVSVQTENIQTDSLEQALRSLLPLRSVRASRALLIPTNGPWTAFFDNAAGGTDAVTPMSYLARTLGCRGLRVVHVPETITKMGGRYGSTILEIYGPTLEDGGFLNYIRSIFAANDGGKWKFAATGTPQSFEEMECYNARRVQDRFTPVMLERYLQALQVDAFNEEFYLYADAVLIRKSGVLPGRDYSLEEVNTAVREGLILGK